MDEHRKTIAILLLSIFFSYGSFAASNYTVLDLNQYRLTVNEARQEVGRLLKALESHRDQNRNEQIAFIAEQLSDTPYSYTGEIGEGDWQPSSLTYRPGALHINQNPVYRLDVLNCQTLVQVAMGLLYSKDIHQFDRNIIRIAYGASRQPADRGVHYFNRNNFVDGDFNPINQRQGLLRDATIEGNLASYSAIATANIERQNWFLAQRQHLKDYIRVLREADGPAMLRRFKTLYSKLKYPHFKFEKVSIAYLPKTSLAIQQSDGTYQANDLLLDKIPTPAVLEMVYDAKKWTVDGQGIKTLIGTELNISHFGLLYRRTFQYGDLIYRKITCEYGEQRKKICSVRPVHCLKKMCPELMLVHATDAYPEHYYWYQESKDHYVCSPKLPQNGQVYTQCNRVERLPLFDYLTTYQYSSHWYMDWPAILGVHIERLS